MGRNRDRFKEGRYPDHMETLTIKNTSPLDADITFCFLHDSKGDTFLLDPPSMMLKPSEQQVIFFFFFTVSCLPDAVYRK